MGTHPIFESDFDCLTENKMTRTANRQKLKDFYKSRARENAELIRQPEINLDSSKFSKEAYVSKILRQMTLASLLEQEKGVGKDICELDHSMQSLVYDNYNKFIKATDTIKQMHNDFHEIEDSMNKLVEEMNAISTITNGINGTMKENRAEIADLVHQSDTLTKIRFLFELPAELNAKIEQRDLIGAVDNYQHHPSFASIQKEVAEALDLLILTLFEPFDAINTDEQTDVALLIESVDLLVKLDQEVRQLSRTFLTKSIKPTEQLLQFLEHNGDLVAYVTHICNYMAELSVYVANFQNIFSLKHLKCSIKYQHSNEVLKEAINDILLEVTELVSAHLATSNMTDDQLSTALDLWYSKLSATAQILPGLNINGRSEDLIIDEATRRFHAIKKELFMQLECEILGLEKVDCIKSTSSAILTLIQKSQEQLERFFTMSKSYSQIEFFLVEWGDMMKSLKTECLVYIADFAELNIKKGNQPILMPLSTFLRAWSTSTIEYCLDKSYPEKLNGYKARYAELCSSSLRAFVFARGAHLAELLTRSIYAKDWLCCSEPRSPRPIVTKIIDEIRGINDKNSSFLPDGVKPTRSQKSGSHVSMAQQQKQKHNSLNIQRLFCDRIEVYGEIKASRIDVTSGIIRIALRALLEAVRTRTFSTFGLQQIQVDMGCFNHVLWRYIIDERELTSLTDEILQSCISRALAFELMESDVIALILEKAQLN